MVSKNNVALKSVSSSQDEILSSIMFLNKIEQFDADITYGNGSFYKNIPEPKYKYGINPQTKDTISANSATIPLTDNSLNSIVYDPPFLTYVKSGREHKSLSGLSSVMSSRFGGYWAYSELEESYKMTLIEARRLLMNKGILVFKCQDIIHNHRMHPTHINIVNWAEGFRLKDMYVLHKPYRMAIPQKPNEAVKKQQHARIHHSYFLILERI